MKRNERTSSPITKSILDGISLTQKVNDKVAVKKPVVLESPMKSPDLCHDAGGAYNSNLSFLQQ